MNKNRSNHNKKKKLKNSGRIKTDLFSLINAVADEVGQDEAHLIPQAVIGILNHNKVTFVNKQNKHTNH